MKRKRIISYLALLFAPMLALGLILSVGTTQARVEGSTTVVNTVIFPQSKGFSSNCLVEGGQTILLGELEAGSTLTITLTIESPWATTGGITAESLSDGLTVSLAEKSGDTTESDTGGTLKPIQTQLYLPLEANEITKISVTFTAPDVVTEARTAQAQIQFENLTGIFQVELVPEVPTGSLENNGGTDETDPTEETDSLEPDSTESDTLEPEPTESQIEFNSIETDDPRMESMTTMSDGRNQTTNTSVETSEPTQTSEESGSLQPETEPEEGNDSLQPSTNPTESEATEPETTESTPEESTEPEPAESTEPDPSEPEETTEATESTESDTIEPSTEPSEGSDSLQPEVDEDAAPASVKMKASAKFSLDRQLPVELTVRGAGKLEIGRSDEENGQLPPFTRYSTDGGESWYLLYFGGTVELRSASKSGWPSLLLLDFSQTSLQPETAMTLTASGAGEILAQSGPIEVGQIQSQPTTVPILRLPTEQEQMAMLAEPGTATGGHCFEVSLPGGWGQSGMLSFAIERLEQQTDGTASYTQIDLTAGQSFVLQETADALAVYLGETPPKAGTYRLTIQCAYEGIQFDQMQMTFFINYSTRSDVQSEEVPNND